MMRESMATMFETDNETIIMRHIKEQPMTDAKEKFNEVLKRLSYREREIVKLRWGFGDGYCYSLGEVAHIFKVTRERIRQIEAKAYRKLWQEIGEEELNKIFADYAASQKTANEKEEK